MSALQFSLFSMLHNNEAGFCRHEFDVFEPTADVTSQNQLLHIHQTSAQKYQEDLCRKLIGL